MSHSEEIKDLAIRSGRRAVLRGAAALAVAAAVPANAMVGVGLSTTPEVFASLATLTGVREGSGSAEVHILYTPWCSAMPELFGMTRPYLDRAVFNWIPYPGDLPEGFMGTQLLLSSGSPNNIPDSFVDVGTAVPDVDYPLAHAQEAAMEGFSKNYYRYVGGSIRIPTLFYVMAGPRYRAIPGRPTPEVLRDIVESAL